MSSRSRKQLEEWLKTIDVNGRVIDIGGSQNPIKGRTKSWNVEDYKILDLEQPHEKKQIADIQMDITISDAVLSDTHEFYAHNEYFDVAFCIEVSEYWANPFVALENINHLMKQGGILYISFHTWYGLHKPEGLDYLRYTRYGIEKLIKETGFKIEEIVDRTITPEGRQYLDNFYKEEGMRILYNQDTFKCGYLIKAKKI